MRASGLLALAGVLLGAAPWAGGARTATPAARAPTDLYFPFRLGDSWTYDWKTEGRRVPARQSSRTRAFEGVEFVGDGPAFKLVSDDGTYHVYSLRDGALAIHSSSEDGRVLYYDPPVLLFAPGLRVGEAHLTSNPDTRRTWKTTLLGREDVTVPLGTFVDCLKVRLELESPEYVADSTHWFAARVGLVAYQYELRGRDRQTLEVKIDARLRLARLSGLSVASIADVRRLEEASTMDLGGSEDSSARDLLRRATERRYTWDDKFPGFRGGFELREDGKPEVLGRFEVGRTLEVSVTAPSEAARALVRNQISSFLTHRRHQAFEAAHARARFRKGGSTPEGNLVVLADGDPMGSTYEIRRDEIVKVGLSAGRLRYVVDNREQLRTEDGRTIAVAYDLTYFSNEDQSEVSVERTTDSYRKVGAYWLPTGRRTIHEEGGRTTFSFDLRLTGLAIPVE